MSDLPPGAGAELTPPPPPDFLSLDPSTCDLDLLMAYIAEINAKPAPLSDPDLTALIAYHRRNRARKAAGEKPARASAPKVDLATLLGQGGKTRDPRPQAGAELTPRPSAIFTGTLRRI